MPYNRLAMLVAPACLVGLAAWAQDPAPIAPPATAAPGAPAVKAALPPTEAEKAIDEAIAKVKALKSVSADVRQDVDMLGQKFAITGQYLRGPDYKVRLQLDLVGLADAGGTMLQICDGNTLWDYQKILDGQSYARLDLGKILARLNGPEFDAVTRDFFIDQRLGFSGPDALLAGLRKSLRFEQKEEGELDGKPVWVLRGTWQDLASLGLAPPGQAVPATTALPAYVPSVATLWIGKEDGWPYQVLLEGKARSVLLSPKQRLGPDGRPMGRVQPAPKEPPSRFLLKYSNVQLDGTIDPDNFAFAVPDGTQVPVADLTSERLAEIEQVAQALAAQRRAEAAKAGESTLGSSLTVPPLGPDPAAVPAVPATGTP